MPDDVMPALQTVRPEASQRTVLPGTSSLALFAAEEADHSTDGKVQILVQTLP